jgi:LURP-one-related
MFRRRAHDPPEGAPAGTRYLLREKLLSLGDDFWIENDRGERIFKVDDKVLRVRDTVVIKDADGKELLKVQKRLLRARRTMAIERGDDTVATVKKALITPLRDRFTVELEGGGSWTSRATSSTTSTRSPGTASRWPTSPSAGSGSATPTAWPSPPARTTPWSWP